MNHVPADCQRQIPANCSRLGVRRVRLAHHLSNRGDGAVPLEDHRDDGACRDIGHQRLEERFPFVFRVVRLGERSSHADESHRGDLESAPLEPRNDFADQSALHRVRLQEDEGAFHHQLPFLTFFAVGAGASSSSLSRFRPFTCCHCPSSHDLNTRRPSGESFHARNSAFSTCVTGFAPCFFFVHPRIEVRNVSPETKSEKYRSRFPRERSGPSRLSIRSERSAGMSFPRGVSIVTSAAPSASTGASSVTTTASSVTRPAARRNACVHGVHRGTRPSFTMFAWHLWEQKRKTVPSLRMNILPVPGSISLPQKEHERRVGIASPDRELAGLARSLAEHEDVSDLDAPLHVARDVAPLVAAVEDADLDLDRFSRHPGPADDLDDLRGNAVIVRHVLSLACPGNRHFFIARIFEATSSMTGFALPGSTSSFGISKRTYIGLGIVETSFRPAAAGRHQSSAPRPRRSGRRSGAGYKRFATVSR